MASTCLKVLLGRKDTVCFDLCCSPPPQLHGDFAICRCATGGVGDGDGDGGWRQYGSVVGYMLWDTFKLLSNRKQFLDIFLVFC